MAEKSKIPAIRFAGFTEAWEQRKLDEIVSFFSGLTYSPNDIRPTGTLVLRSSNVKDGEVIDADNVYVDPSVVNSDNVHDGDIIVVVRNGSRTLIGKHAEIKGLMPNTVIGAFMTGIRSEHPSFLNSLLSTPHFDKEIERNMGATINQITGYMFSKMEFMIPSSKEQDAIGEYFKRISNLITLHQRKLDRLKNIKKSMLDKMFPKDGEVVPEIRFKGFTDAWEQRKLGDIGTITTGSTPSTSIPDYYSDDGIIWVTPTDISENITFKSARKLSELGQQVGRVVPKNTILVTCIASIGKNTMLGNTGSFNQQINGLTPNENKYEPYFLLIESEIWSAQMRKSAAAGTMQIINRTEFSGLETWIPKLNEQKVIGTYFRNLDNLITLHQRKLDKLKNIKKSMLDNMFV